MSRCKVSLETQSKNGHNKYKSNTHKRNSKNEMIAECCIDLIFQNIFKQNDANVNEQSIKRFDTLRSKQISNIIYISPHYFVHICQMRHYFSCLVNNKARTSLIREVLYTLSWHYLYELHLTIFLSHTRKMHVDQVAKLITRLIQMKHNERLRIGFGHLSNILISWYFNNFSIFHFLSILFQLIHPFGHVLFSKFIIVIYINQDIPN